LISELKEALKVDPQLNIVMQLCLQNKPPNPHYSMSNQLLYWKGRLVLPKGHRLVKKILYKFHNTLLVGHSGFTRTLQRIASQFYWSGMQKDIKEVVQ